MWPRIIGLGLALWLVVGPPAGRADERDSPAARGYQWLISKPYLPPDFDQEVFDALYKQWPKDLRVKAEKASADERRRMAFDYYGLTARPNRGPTLPKSASGPISPKSASESTQPLQYVIDDAGQWHMNCFACHGGQVVGQVVPGAPNSLFALQTLTEDVRVTKLLMGKPLAHMDLGSLAMPLGHTNGTTNAVMFGVALVALRNPDLSLKKIRRPPPMTHHDMDAPPWWHFKKKNHLYIDGFANKGARPLMQFMLARENGPDKFREWEADFRDVYAFLESIEPPKYPYEIDHELAVAGERVFNKHCAECHGTYDADPEKETYPNRLVPIDEVATDRVRLDALSPEARARYGATWFTHFGDEKIVEDPGGYVAPPLDGVWASAPYFHNGSVPTLWHVLHPDERPKIWKRRPDGYDQAHVGLEIETFDRLPPEVDSARTARSYFDARGFGKSAAGHLFPDELNVEEKQGVLEYLKTL